MFGRGLGAPALRQPTCPHGHPHGHNTLDLATRNQGQRCPHHGGSYGGFPPRRGGCSCGGCCIDQYADPPICPSCRERLRTIDTLGQSVGERWDCTDDRCQAWQYMYEYGTYSGGWGVGGTINHYNDHPGLPPTRRLPPPNGCSGLRPPTRSITMGGLGGGLGGGRPPRCGGLSPLDPLRLNTRGRF